MASSPRPRRNPSLVTCNSVRTQSSNNAITRASRSESSMPPSCRPARSSVRPSGSRHDRADRRGSRRVRVTAPSWTFAPRRLRASPPGTRTVLETSSQTGSAGATGQAAAVCWGSGVHEAPAEHVPEGREVDALLSRVLLAPLALAGSPFGWSFGHRPVRRSGRFTLVEELGLSWRARSQVGAGEPHG